MEQSQAMAENPTLAESLSSIEFDLHSESFRATFDSVCDSASLAVVAAVATALGRERHNLTPLQSIVDTDALDSLAAESSAGIGNCASISFSYEGLEVVVTGKGLIEANPIANT